VARPAEKVYTPRSVETAYSEVPAPKLASIEDPKPSELPKPVPAMDLPARNVSDVPVKKPGDTSSGLSPAVVYLQNLKLQMDRLDKDVTGLKAVASQLAAQQIQQTELVLKRLDELSEKLRNPMPSSAAAASGSAPAGNSSSDAGGDGSPPLAEPAPAPIVVAPPPDAPVQKEERREPTAEMIIAAAEPQATVVEASQASSSAAEDSAAPAAADRTPDPASDKTMVIEPTAPPIKLGGSDIPAPARPGFESTARAGAGAVPDETIRVDVTASPAKRAPAASDPKAPQHEPPKPARKGPVWPI
jgi:hypothetical protein